MVNLATAAVAIVIATHNRPDELRRLCNSLLQANVPDQTPLIISIDGGAPEEAETVEFAQSFRWNRGPVQVIEHEHLGLVGHFHACGDLTGEHGSVVFLEDDLVVGPAFYEWTLAALEAAESDDRIAGVSLAAPFFDGYRHLPFEPVIDGSDGIYMQVPWYDGMAWTAAMWTRFREHTTSDTTPLHAAFAELGDDEWFPDVMRYLVETGRYYLLPRHAHATNSGAAGAHFAARTDYFQVPLTLRGPSSYAIAGLHDSLAVYDDHMELTTRTVQQLVPELTDYWFVVDLLGTRDLSSSRSTHILTTRATSRAERQWGASMHPLIANLTHDVLGDAISLAEHADVHLSPDSDAVSLHTLKHHARRGRTPSGRDAVRQLATTVKETVRRGR